MRFKRQSWWFILAALVLVFPMMACGVFSGSDAEDATEPPASQPAKLPAIATLTATSTVSAEGESPGSSGAAPTAAPVGTGGEEPPAGATPTPGDAGSGGGLPSPTPTFTPTPAGGVVGTPSPATRCSGLSGEIEVKVVVGPAEAVGLEPLAVGTVPFAVASGQAPYPVQGGGAISYDNTLTADWGTYQVMLDMAMTVAGECIGAEGSESLQLTLEASGEQMVEVNAGGFQGQYPWQGTNTFDLEYPLVDGATVEGEGYVFILHLSGQ
jgi:hypothetical protein